MISYLVSRAIICSDATCSFCIRFKDYLTQMIDSCYKVLSFWQRSGWFSFYPVPHFPRAASKITRCKETLHIIGLIVTPDLSYFQLLYDNVTILYPGCKLLLSRSFAGPIPGLFQKSDFDVIVYTGQHVWDISLFDGLVITVDDSLITVQFGFWIGIANNRFWCTCQVSLSKKIETESGSFNPFKETFSFKHIKNQNE